MGNARSTASRNVEPSTTEKRSAGECTLDPSDPTYRQLEEEEPLSLAEELVDEVAVGTRPRDR
ncbi:MAG: hypothetical protein GTO03_13750, partial [Planctomycetales bacterium]|nr:hypothetical protein [Planctomycetales bacterium]